MYSLPLQVGVVTTFTVTIRKIYKYEQIMKFRFLANRNCKNDVVYYKKISILYKGKS